jgi:uncharacterized membrane protein YGL010W
MIDFPTDLVLIARILIGEDHMGERIAALLAEYFDSHRNETNKVMHWICVPLIVWSLMALLWAIPVPDIMKQIAGLNWLVLMLVFALIYCVILSPTLAVGVSIYAAICVWIIIALARAGLPTLWIAAGVFVAALTGQFGGHKVEGKKPSFLKDIQFLRIGPA